MKYLHHHNGLQSFLVLFRPRSSLLSHLPGRMSNFSNNGVTCHSNSRERCRWRTLQYVSSPSHRLPCSKSVCEANMSTPHTLCCQDIICTHTRRPQQCPMLDHVTWLCTPCTTSPNKPALQPALRICHRDHCRGEDRRQGRGYPMAASLSEAHVRSAVVEGRPTLPRLCLARRNTT